MKLCEVFSVCIFLICLWAVRETLASLKENKVNVTAIRGNYDEAVNYCKSIGLKLIRINNDSDNRLVHGLAVKNSVGRYWIDGKWNRNNATWVNMDNATLTYTKWDRVEPNNKSGSEFCVEGNFYSSEYWNDINCNVENGIICYDDKEAVTTRKPYSFIDLKIQRKFDDAVTACKGVKGTLPRIDSEEKRTKVNQGANSFGYKFYWIDLTRNNENSGWRYDDGTPAPYAKIDASDDDKQVENCAYYHQSKNKIYSAACEFAFINVICEIKT